MAVDSVSAAATAATPDPAAAAPRWRHWLDLVYPAVRSRPLSARTALLTVLGIVAAAAVNLLRTGGAGALQTMWIEDVIVFMNDAYNKRFADVIFHPESGYFHLVPRLLAEVASEVPARWAAPVLATEAATVWGIIAVVVFMASRPYLPTWWLRLLVAAPVVFVPVGHTQVDNDVATLHHIFLYGLFWIMLWQPVTRAGKIAAVVITLLAAGSSILALALVPLALLRLVAVRDWAARTVSLVYLAGMGLQVFGLASGVSSPWPRVGHYNPFWALTEWAVTAVPRGVFGELWMGGPKVDLAGVPTADYYLHPGTQIALTMASLVIVAAAVICALLRVTDPHWPLAILSGVFGILLFCEPTMVMGLVEPRYVIPAALLLYVSFVALLRPRPGTARLSSTVPVAAFTVLLVVVGVANYRVQNARATSPAWSDFSRQATAYCDSHPAKGWDYYGFGYGWWQMNVPCDRFRG